MRKVLFIPLITITLFACTNKKEPSIKKTWIGSHLEYLKIEDTLAFLDKGQGTISYTRYIKDNKKLQLINGNWHIPGRTDTAFFEIKRLTEDSLIIRTLKHDSTLLYFIDETKTVNPNFKFQKISYYRRGGSLGRPPVKIDIDSSGAIFYEKHTDTSCTIYKGQLKLSDLTKLDSILSRSCLNNWPSKFEFAYDAAEHEFIFHYNQKKKECVGCEVPDYGWKVGAFMESIPKNYSFQEYHNFHKFEDDSTFPQMLPPPPSELIKNLRVTPLGK